MALSDQETILPVVTTSLEHPPGKIIVSYHLSPNAAPIFQAEEQLVPGSEKQIIILGAQNPIPKQFLKRKTAWIKIGEGLIEKTLQVYPIKSQVS